MYSANDIQQMTDRQARQALDALAVRHYGTERWKAQFATDTGLARSTVQRWSDGRPPVWAFVLLSALADRADAVNKLAAIKAALDAAFGAETPPSSAQS
jgi:hypothetical protein